MSEARGALDGECDVYTSPDLSVRSASARGAGHRHSPEPRRDCARIAVHEPSGAVVFAVAVGVAGATDAGLGALEACRAAMERMLYLLSADTGPLDFENVAHHAADRLGQLAARRWDGAGSQGSATCPERYATTLVAGVVRPGLDGPHVQICRIGGCDAWLLDRATGAYHALFGLKNDPDRGFASHTAGPLPFVPDSIEAVAEHLTPSEVLLVGTDGFAGPLGGGDGPLGALLARHLATPPTPLRLAEILDFSGESFDEDQTLVGVWPGAPAGRR